MEIEKAVDEQSFTHGFHSVYMPKKKRLRRPKAFHTEAVMMIYFITEYTNDDKSKLTLPS
ncbi:hypothetical protein D3P09_21240 [Paenibacillus pinisoli]|uniref:Uncharacterized protein n=1 Tax=Paenibacillus pinisoli TaxID=1276110 RepID=A0A3A6PC83_9BACL|nr:hypothetical protein D3P09_21240 [Paenibacillus pinisoli]